MLGRTFALLFALVSLSSCATSSEASGTSEHIVPLSMSELPPPSGIKTKDDRRPYYLGPQDKISVTVFGQDALSMPSVEVSGGGTIDLPLIGEVKAQGQTTGELARAIEERLATVLQNPQVSVNILAPVSQSAVVDGAVESPGLQPLVGRATLERVIANAGGTKEFAIVERVAVVRNVDGKTMVALYNLKDIRKGRRADPEIFPGDKISVGKSAIRTLFKDVLSTIPLIYLINSI